MMNSRNAYSALIGTLITAVSGCGGELESTDRLVVWTTESDARAVEISKKLEAEFETRNPDVDLVLEVVSWNDLSERLINASQSGNWPDVSHVQPFMAYSLYSRGELLPITDVRTAVEAANGPILPAVRDLQVFGDNKDVYGIAYAVGTTFWSLLGERLPDQDIPSEIRTWDDYIDLAARVHAEDPENNKVTLPGGSPFFMDQLFGELVANAGGKFFDEKACPILTSPPVVAALNFFQDLENAGVLAPDWPSQTYADQFNKLGNGTIFSAPVTYARASQTVKQVYAQLGRNSGDANERTIVWLDQPTLQAGIQSVATIDAEPWVVFKATEGRVQANGTKNIDLAKEFLEMFYSRDFYAEYTSAVPIHMTPIFETMATDPAYAALTQPFESWHLRTLTHLRNGTVRPILMPDMSDTGRSIPFLLEFQRAGILSGAISDVLRTDNGPEEAAERAQLRATELVRRSGYTGCSN